MSLSPLSGPGRGLALPAVSLGCLPSPPVLPRPLRVPPQVRPIPALFIFTADHFLSFAFIQDLTLAACFNWWGWSVVVLNWRQMVLKQGPHTETRSNSAGRAGSRWVGCFAEVPEARGGERQRGARGSITPPACPSLFFSWRRVFPRRVVESLPVPTPSPDGVPVTKKALFAGRMGWEEPCRAMAGAVPSPCRSGDGAWQRLPNEGSIITRY